MAKDSQLFIRIAETERDTFRDKCLQSGQSPSEVLRRMVEAFNRGQITLETKLEMKTK